METSDKKIIITGGNNGIGLNLCKNFLNRGFKVFMIDKDKILNPSLINENMYFYSGDLSSKTELECFYNFVVSKTDDIDYLINNACDNRGGLISGCSYEDFDYVLSVGLKAPYMLTLLFKEMLIESGGCIVNIASSRAFQSQENTEPYSSAKGGIVALTHALSISLKGMVRVNAIAPGWIDICETNILSNEDRCSIPVERVGCPNDVFNLIEFLLDEKSSFINGETITLDGGMSKQMIYHNDYGWQYKYGSKK